MTTPQDLIKPEYLDEFSQAKDYFYLEQVVPLHMCMYVLRKLAEFPFDLFLTSDRWIFFRLVFRNTVSAVVLAVTRLMTDSGADTVTLPAFRNRMMTEMVKPECRCDFSEVLRLARFDANVESLLDDIRTIRNRRYAHILTIDVVGDDGLPRVTHSQFQCVVEALTALVRALFFEPFGEAVSMLPLEYSEQVEWPYCHSSDIDYVLDLVARNSDVMSMPEDEPLLWPYHAWHMSDRQMAQYNEYRSKFGLPVVSHPSEKPEGL